MAQGGTNKTWQNIVDLWAEIIPLGADSNLTLKEVVVILELCLVPKISQHLIAEAILKCGYAKVMEAIACMIASLYHDQSQPLNRSDLEEMIILYPDF